MKSGRAQPRPYHAPVRNNVLPVDYMPLDTPAPLLEQVGVYLPYRPSRIAFDAAGEHPADEDESVLDPEPLILEPYPTARWTGVVIGLGVMAIIALGLACEKRDTTPRPVTGAPVTMRLLYPAHAGWIPTGITLDPEMIVHVHATGTVEAAPPDDMRAGYHAVPPAGRDPESHHPEPKQPGLALLGKVNAFPFLLGERQAFRVHEKGSKLMLGMNDANPNDNRGHWHVEITVHDEKP